LRRESIGNLARACTSCVRAANHDLFQVRAAGSRGEPGWGYTAQSRLWLILETKPARSAAITQQKESARRHKESLSAPGARARVTVSPGLPAGIVTRVLIEV
jgi:hypothetical protein